MPLTSVFNTQYVYFRISASILSCALTSIMVLKIYISYIVMCILMQILPDREGMFWMCLLFPPGGRVTLTFPWMRSICTFWVWISFPISRAMLRRLPRMLPTCVRFSSMSSSRASFVTLWHVEQWNSDKQRFSNFTQEQKCTSNTMDFQKV